MTRKFKKTIFFRLLAFIAVVAVTLAAVPTPAVHAMGGSGTQNDPYLVTTAEELSAIRNNLSAHYKLADTIDLSGITDFVPIGNLERPFTGSLTCDLGKDNLPKYAIKNLKVHVAETAYVAENQSKWEAGLFGASQGATFSNIFLLNVTVSNDNYGDNTGNVIYGNYKPGMDEQASGALAGFAINTAINGCMSSGNIDTRSNNVGGLIGKAEGSTIANCYSTANVLSQGKWGVGGLIGTLDDSTLSSSFYQGGQVSCGSEYSSQGMLFASANNCIISDCYTSGQGLGGQGNIGSFSNSTVTNCYTTASVSTAILKDYIGSPSGNTIQNVYILDSVSVVSINIEEKYSGIQRGSAAQIKEAFSGNPAWDTSGTYPTLTSITILTDESRYVPGAGETGDGAGTDGTGTGTAGVTGGAQGTTTVTTTEVDAEEPKRVEELKKIVEGLPEPAKLTADHIDDVLKAKNILDNLSDSAYAQLDSAIAAKVGECYTAMQPVMIEYLVAEVEKLDVEKLTAEDKEAVLRLYEIYNGLDEGSKDAFSSTLLEKLESAVKKVQQFSDDMSTNIVRPMTMTEKLIVLILIIIALLIFAANVILIVMVVRRKKLLEKLCADVKEETPEINDQNGNEV